MEIEAAGSCIGIDDFSTKREVHTVQLSVIQIHINPLRYWRGGMALP